MKRTAAGLAILLAGSPLLASGATRDFTKVEIKTTEIAEDFYTLEGAGGTVSVLLGSDGVLLVDSQFAALTDKLLAAIRKLSHEPIRFLVNTHFHGDHTGGNANFAKLGVVIFSRDQLRERLAHPAPAADGSPATQASTAGLPMVTYDGRVTIHLDDEEVDLVPIRNAHTDGDTLIAFAHHDILVVGDYYRGVGYPYVDLKNGGSLDGLLDALGVTIGRAGPKTKIIPGHGPVTDRSGLIAQRDLILAVRDKVAELIARHYSLEEIVAAHPTAEFDVQVPNGKETADEFVTWLYHAVQGS
jgi:cyclase